MKRHAALVPLSRQHHQFLLLAQLLKKDAPPYKGMPTDLVGKAQYAKGQWPALEAHFKQEEAVVYPAAHAHEALGQLLSQLREEHARLGEGFVQILQDQFSEELLDQLGHLLERHIRTEERQLFQQMQALLTEAEMDQLSGQLNA